MPDIKQITTLLKQEHALRLRHCRLLEAQQAALLACDRARFTTLEPEHADIVALLADHEALRTEALFGDDGEAITVSVLLETLPEGRVRQALAAARDALVSAAERTQTLSRRNEMLIRNELSYLEFSLDLFVEAGRAAGQSYGGGALLGGRLGLDRRA